MRKCILKLLFTFLNLWRTLVLYVCRKKRNQGGQYPDTNVCEKAKKFGPIRKIGGGNKDDRNPKRRERSAN